MRVHWMMVCKVLIDVRLQRRLMTVSLILGLDLMVWREWENTSQVTSGGWWGELETRGVLVWRSFNHIRARKRRNYLQLLTMEVATSV
jgi:hypothetical protein